MRFKITDQIDANSFSADLTIPQVSNGFDSTISPTLESHPNVHLGEEDMSAYGRLRNTIVLHLRMGGGSAVGDLKQD